MATWKKILTSGSLAEVAGITASNASGFKGEGRDLTFTDTAMVTGDSLVFVDADGGTKKDTVADIVTLLSGDGIKNASNKFAIDASDFAGTGLSADGSENINIDAAQTGINSILATDLVLGEDAQTKIDFETVNEIHFDVNNVELLNLNGNIISGSAISTGSFGHVMVNGQDFITAVSSSAADSGFSSGDITSVVAGDGLTDGGTAGDVTLNIGAGTGIDVASDAISVDVSDFMSNGSNNRIVTATGTDAMNAEANLTFDGSTLTVAGNLVVNGTTTTVATTNTSIKDQFILLASGSSATNVDAGIVVQSGSVAGSGSAFYHDKSDERWAVAKGIAHSRTEATTPTQFVTTVKSSTSTPGASDGDFGVGEMWVDTDASEPTGDGVIYIRTG
tara:strand:+ start:557 stop:1729 length:1173 start_codon:yes stop_codon:yes gene_type:complete